VESARSVAALVERPMTPAALVPQEFLFLDRAPANRAARGTSRRQSPLQTVADGAMRRSMTLCANRRSDMGEPKVEQALSQFNHE
jgi:hypothetical protein